MRLIMTTLLECLCSLKATSLKNTIPMSHTFCFPKITSYEILYFNTYLFYALITESIIVFLCLKKEYNAYLFISLLTISNYLGVFFYFS